MAVTRVRINIRILEGLRWQREPRHFADMLGKVETNTEVPWYKCLHLLKIQMLKPSPTHQGQVLAGGLQEGMRSWWWGLHDVACVFI